MLSLTSLDSNKTAGEEARRQLHKNATCNLEQVLAATPYKTPTVRPPAPPITKTTQVRRTRHAGHCWRSRDKLIRDVLLWTPTHGRAKQDDQHEHIFSSYVRIRDVVLKTYLGRWTIGEEWQGRARDIRAISAIWWWWWWESQNRKCNLIY